MMTPVPRPAAVLTVLAAILLLGPCVPSRADDADAAARHDAADELLTTMHLHDVVGVSSRRMETSIDQIATRMEKQPNATPEQIADAKQLREEMHAVIDKALGWDAVKGEVVQSYADAFTLAELKEISAFYHSPVGQKLVEKQPGLSDKFGKVIQQKSMTLVPTIRQKIQEATLKHRPPPPTASPAGPAPVVPLAPGLPAAPPAGPVMSLPAANAPLPVPTPVASPTIVPVPSPAK